MTKPEAIAAIKLLSALESWAMSQSSQMPDYLHENLQRSMEVLVRSYAIRRWFNARLHRAAQKIAGL